MTAPRHGWAGLPLPPVMLHRNIAFLGARNRISMLGLGIADELHLFCDRTGRRAVGFAHWHRGSVV